MKKLLSLSLIALSVNLFAQSSIKLFYKNSTNSVTPSSNIYTTTVAGQMNKMTFDIQNVGAASHTYHVKRTDLMIHAAQPDSAKANFCFAGTCYGTDVKESLFGLELGAGERSNVIYSDTMYYSLDADLLEGSTIGFSLVRYKVYEESNPADSVIFTMVYNNGVGIVEQGAKTASVKLFPNPAKDMSNVIISSNGRSQATVQVYNSIGELVAEKSVGLEDGKNNIPLDLSGYAKGIYITQVKSGNQMISKKLIVE